MIGPEKYECKFYVLDFLTMNCLIVFLFSLETSSDMKLLLAAIFLFLIVETNAQWYNFPGQAYEGNKHLHKNNMYNCNVIYLLC